MMEERVDNPSVSEKIREQLRKETGKVRLQHRQDAANRVRKNFKDTEEELKVFKSLTRVELVNVVAKVKQGTQTSLFDLRALKQALNEPQHIVEFLRTTGGLQAVVGHLTGRKPLHQLEAAYICCNVATGNEHACETVAHAAGAYLIGYLDSQNKTLQESCLWTLGNLAAGSSKSLTILKSQGLVSQLITCLKSPHIEVVEATLYALCLVMKSSLEGSSGCEVSSEEKKEIAHTALELSNGKETVDWLLLIYLLSCKPDCDEIFLGKLLPKGCIDKLSGMFLEAPLDTDDLLLLRSATALIRITANLAFGHNGQAAMMILNHQSFIPVFKYLLYAKQNHLCNESNWLGMNLLNHSCDDVRIKAKSSGLCDLMKLDII